ncbi:SRSF protein kinase [Trichophyton interdigitale]|nr:SRSF protein kinase [Trichophyton interdigitale]KAG5218540.1 SRSF protein kinase [Trichophyton interdigitale]KAG8206994.1 SRSF protein kinase [Trichophyton interdigitale]
MEAATCSLRRSKMRSAHELLYLPTARAIIADLVLTVQSLHDRGIVHGDIHGGNILLRLPEDINRIKDATTLYRRFGEPITKPVVRVDRQPLDVGVPTHVHCPIRLSVRSDEIMDSHLPIMLSDFTSSYYPSRTRQIISRTLPHIVPPEAFFIDEHKKDESLSFPSEIWTLACTVFDILGGGGPFSVMGGGILQDQASALGKFPEPWWSQWEERAEFFTDDGASIVFPNSKDSLEDRYDWFVTAARRRYKMEYPDEEEKRAFLQMLGPMLRYVPGERASIRDVVNSEWMQKWALPCMHRRSS